MKGTRDYCELDKQADSFLEKLKDKKFVKEFASAPSNAMRKAGMDFDIFSLVDKLSKNKDVYRIFMESIADTVDVNMLRDVLAASTCEDTKTPVF